MMLSLDLTLITSTSPLVVLHDGTRREVRLLRCTYTHGLGTIGTVDIARTEVVMVYLMIVLQTLFAVEIDQKSDAQRTLAGERAMVYTVVATGKDDIAGHHVATRCVAVIHDAIGEPAVVGIAVADGKVDYPSTSRHGALEVESADCEVLAGYLHACLSAEYHHAGLLGLDGDGVLGSTGALPFQHIVRVSALANDDAVAGLRFAQAVGDLRQRDHVFTGLSCHRNH